MKNIKTYNLKELMKLCTDYAIEGVNENIGGPFGAAVVKKEDDKFKLISLARNSVISSNDPTAHAEINAIREACTKLNTFDLSGYILITTGQSCPMCLSAIIWSNIKEIYYGTDYEDGINQALIYLQDGKNIAKYKVTIPRDDGKFTAEKISDITTASVSGYINTLYINNEKYIENNTKNINTILGISGNPLSNVDMSKQGIGSGAGYIEISNGTYTIDPSMN